LCQAKKAAADLSYPLTGCDGKTFSWRHTSGF